MARIVQQALSNVRRHVDASRVDIIFQRLNGNLRVEIRDDGGGFNPKDISSGKKRRNYGVRSMADRARYLGGSIDIKSKPGDGTTVMLEVPLGKDDELKN